MYLRPIIHCAMNVIVFKLNWVTIYWWEKKGKKKQLTRNDKNTKQNKLLKQKKKRTCCWRTDWTNEVLFTLCYIYFKEPGQSATDYHGRKTRVSFVSCHVVLTALTVSSLALSIYAVNRLGATPVDPNMNYRMWSLVGMPNVGLMVLNPSGSIFYCNGSFNGGGSKFPFLNWFSPFYEATWKWLLAYTGSQSAIFRIPQVSLHWLCARTESSSPYINTACVRDVQFFLEPA